MMLAAAKSRSHMFKPAMLVTSAVASLSLAGCGFQLVAVGLPEKFDGFELSAPANSRIEQRLRQQLEDYGMSSQGDKSVSFRILREDFTASRSLASSAATLAEIQLNLSVQAMITLPGEAPFRVEYKLHDFYPINYRDPHGNRALRRNLEEYLAGEAAMLLIESVSNPTRNERGVSILPNS